MTNSTVNPLYMIAGLIVLIVAISFGVTKNKKEKIRQTKKEEKHE